MTTVSSIHVGRARPLPADGRLSAIHKQAVVTPVNVAPLGLDGDEQADRRVHGGPDQAVHHYAAENYQVFRDAFPDQAEAFQPGTIGENISTTGMDESSVRVGDIYRIGTCLFEVSQPRSPCWKIDRRYGIDRLSRFVQERRIAGWYYRVLEPGVIRAGDPIERVQQSPVPVSLVEFWDIYLLHRPELADLELLLSIDPLSREWKRKIQTRVEWLRKNS